MIKTFLFVLGRYDAEFDDNKISRHVEKNVGAQMSDRQEMHIPAEAAAEARCQRA